MRPSRMVENDPNERTVASSKTSFGLVTQVRKTVVHTYAVPLVAPSARRALVPQHRKDVDLFLAFCNLTILDGNHPLNNVEE